jgi:PP-loop superfamily ATP-utilizing enzyme
LQGCSAEGLLVIVDGSNADDEGDFRPAATLPRKWGCARHWPSCRKSLIRQMAKAQDCRTGTSRLVPAWLADPYGQEITPLRLKRVAEAEAAFAASASNGARARSWHAGENRDPEG